MTAVMGTKLIRKEDPKLLTGEGKYIDDIHAPGELWMGMVRSTMAHASISSIDTSAAEAMDGVHSVYTGAQLQDMGLWAAPLRQQRGRSRSRSAWSSNRSPGGRPRHGCS